MSILTTNQSALDKSVTASESILTARAVTQGKYELSMYSPSAEEKEMRAMILKHFALGYVTMYTPRVEFNDLSVISRMTVDQMAFNTYQSNNGQAAYGDEVNGWRSRAMRPIVRNKVVSIAAHATAQLIFPKVFAYNETNDEQQDAATVMEDLMEWAGDQSDYAQNSLYRTVTALTDPASIGYTEYTEVYRQVKRPKAEGGYTQETILDSTLSGFQDITVPTDELFIENFFESNIQKQGWLIWRRVISFSLAEAKYKDKYKNFQYVKPGVQILYNDANQSFYQVYDTNMRPYDVEEVMYWNRSLDVKIIIVNGVMLTEPDNPNPRNDKLYPFDKFGYEIINNRCFYYKSLAFKMQHDAEIINTLYPMIIDKSYLSLMPPMVQIGDEIIGSDVIVPGAVTTLQSANADLRAITMGNGMPDALNALNQVEASISETTESVPSFGGARKTAYQLSLEQQNATTILGLFVQMISQHVKDYGRLRLGDILQYLTIIDTDKITGDASLVYKTFLVNKGSSTGGKAKVRKISFDGGMSSEPMSGEDQLNASYDVLNEQGGTDSNVELYKANPELFRNLTYMLTVSPDALNPKSEQLERTLHLETFDRMITSPAANQEEALRLLLTTDSITKKSPDKYVMQQQPAQQPGMPLNPNQMSPIAGPMQQAPQPPQPTPGPVAAPSPQQSVAMAKR